MIESFIQSASVTFLISNSCLNENNLILLNRGIFWSWLEKSCLQLSFLGLFIA